MKKDRFEFFNFRKFGTSQIVFSYFEMIGIYIFRNCAAAELLLTQISIVRWFLFFCSIAFQMFAWTAVPNVKIALLNDAELMQQY